MVLLKRKVLDALKILLCLSGQAMAILLWKATRLLSQLSLRLPVAVGLVESLMNAVKANLVLPDHDF